MINTTDIQKALIEIKNKQTIVMAQNPAFDRKILEKASNITLVSIEKNTKHTTIREIDSGFNHVLASIAAKKHNLIGLDLEQIRSLPKKEKALRLEKIIQNIRLCRKKGIRISTNLTNNKDILISLGTSTNQVKSSITQSF